jgi:hypothetical protein
MKPKKVANANNQPIKAARTSEDMRYDPFLHLYV